MKIEFIASVAVITDDPAASRRLYVETLGLPLSGQGDYIYSDQVAGSRHFGVWPLTEAARSCFGADQWPAELPVPQVSIEFEVAGVEAVGDAAAELTAAGYELLHGPKQEPWGQTLARLLSPEGALVGISYAPSMH